MFKKKPEFERMNQMGKQGTPFLFVIDFECEFPLVIPLDEASGHEIFFDFRGVSNVPRLSTKEFAPLEFEKKPVDFETYRHAWIAVMQGLNFGNSYLLNLTFPTEISINRTLGQIFQQSSAPYRLLFKDKFTVFSPESFIRIEDSIISSFPMKGTIDANLPDAADILMNDSKELAEHRTIVDLIRNDLSMVADQVRVKRFRYLESIKTNQRNLLQASSEISGNLPADWQSKLGDILLRLLPAGSISGAPKQKTVEIIQQTESGPRGYYTGVCGIFDGKSLDSAVMIRFIENQQGRMIFRSGGGITVNSEAEKEYRELIDKVYVTSV
jgi:para-aminobenzoate synthetase component 1